MPAGPTRYFPSAPRAAVTTVGEIYVENRQRVQSTGTSNHGSAHGGTVVE